MSDLFVQSDDAATLLTPQEMRELIPSHIAYRRERFSWGRASLRDAGVARGHYIQALRSADHHDIGLLLAFARA